MSSGLKRIKFSGMGKGLRVPTFSHDSEKSKILKIIQNRRCTQKSGPKIDNILVKVQGFDKGITDSGATVVGINFAT